jgi:hypothetical protein
MKERPILFQGAMVRALLAGTKTQTRRAMRVQPGDETTVTVEHFNQTVIDRHGDEQPGPEVFGAWWDDGESGLRCPYGQPGDRLWVRETWAYHLHAQASQRDEDGPWVYAADGRPALQVRLCDRWRPSIHMPRVACRLTLDVTRVRVERLQEISDEDALAEGVDRTNTSISGYAKERYRTLWDSINGVGSWDANPWVWAVSFKRMEAQQ